VLNRHFKAKTKFTGIVKMDCLFNKTKPKTLAEMQKRYPCYKGTLENFDEAKVRNHISNREARKLYKRACRFWDQKQKVIPAAQESTSPTMSERRGPTSGVLPPPSHLMTGAQKAKITQVADCPRCFLIKRGNIFISDRILCTCTVSIPEGVTVYEQTNCAEAEPDTCEFSHVLAVSTALGAVWQTPPMEKDQPIQSLIASRSVEQRSEDDEDAYAHQCVEAEMPEFGEAKEIFLKSDMEKIASRETLNSSDVSLSNVSKSTDEAKGSAEPKATHCVIYAPPGFGKTTFQKNLMRAGIYTRDTDDMPFVNKMRLKGVLNTSTVLTNRLDLLTPDMPIIACIPKDANHVNRTRSELSVEDCQYWFNCHRRLYHYERIVIIETNNAFVSDCFEVPGTEAKLPIDHTLYRKLDEYAKALEDTDLR
jgi:hypothetical protein